MPPTPQFEELDYQETPLGGVSLRRRIVLMLDGLEVYEIKLNDDFLMSSLFTTVEIELSHLGLAAAKEVFPGQKLDVVVGGLGLGYTAQAALQHPELESLIVVDYLPPVIAWHEQGLAPLGPELCADERCRFVHGDFFQLALAEKSAPSFDPDDPERKFHAILLDIDHSPCNLLHERHGEFYQAAGLRQFREKLHPGGIFALWSDDRPDQEFMEALNEVFAQCEAHVVSFHNPLQDRERSSTVYVARG